MLENPDSGIDAMPSRQGKSLGNTHVILFSFDDDMDFECCSRQIFIEFFWRSTDDVVLPYHSNLEKRVQCSGI